MTPRYHRTTSFDCEELEDELVIMELEIQAVVTLNSTAQAVWDGLDGGATLDDLEAIFKSAFPDTDASILLRDIQGVLDTLVAAGLATADGNSGQR